MINYGYITGDFDIDPENDSVLTNPEDDSILEIVRINEKGKKEYLICIKTNRDTSDLNMHVIGDARAFSLWRSANEKKTAK